MIPDTLYDLAFQFKQTKLWKKLYDSQLFAVQHADGSIGYCCVMGMMGEHLALAAYPGDEGMDSYRLMGKDRSRMDSYGLRETALSQDCVMLSFENKSELAPREIHEVSAYCSARGLKLRGKKAYPQLQRFRPNYLPWYIDDETDQTRLIEALEAAAEVSKKLSTATPEALGFSEGALFGQKIPLLQKTDGAFLWSEIALPKPKPVCHKSPEISDQIGLKRLSKIKKRSGEWACDIFMHINPMSDEADGDDFLEEPKNAPFFPYLLIIMDHRSGMVFDVQISKNPEDYSEHFAQAFLDIALKRGRPTRILVSNDRSYAMFSKLAAQIDVKLVMKKQIPLLDEAKQGFLEHFSGEVPEPEEQMEQMEQLTALLHDPEMRNEMPAEMLSQLSQLAEMGMLPDDLAEIIRQECNRRGMQ